jgi:hypothetical protein
MLQGGAAPAARHMVPAPLKGQGGGGVQPRGPTCSIYDLEDLEEEAEATYNLEAAEEEAIYALEAGVDVQEAGTQGPPAPGPHGGVEACPARFPGGPQGHGIHLRSSEQLVSRGPTAPAGSWAAAAPQGGVLIEELPSGPIPSGSAPGAEARAAQAGQGGQGGAHRPQPIVTLPEGEGPPGAPGKSSREGTPASCQVRSDISCLMPGE